MLEPFVIAQRIPLFEVPYTNCPEGHSFEVATTLGMVRLSNPKLAKEKGIIDKVKTKKKNARGKNPLPIRKIKLILCI